MIKVDVAHPGASISSQMFGIFFEDINFAADGGLYPELERIAPLSSTSRWTGWHEIMGISSKGIDTSKGELSIVLRRSSKPNNPHYLKELECMKAVMDFGTPASGVSGSKADRNIASLLMFEAAERRLSARRLPTQPATKSQVANCKASTANGSATKPSFAQMERCKKRS